MKKIKFGSLILLLFLMACNSYEEVSFTSNNDDIDLSNKIVFYNVENLFDTINTPLKRDGEFTPDGSKKWNSDRYQSKINNISKTFIGIGSGKMPSIIGLSEVENYDVLKDLCYQSPLEKFGYNIIHHESSDRRGIDVALLYLPQEFELQDTVFVKVNLGGNYTTREILYVKLKQLNSDIILNIFVNHWPSRYLGQNKSEYKRILAAKTLKKYSDSLSLLNENILIMGDFNDYYYNSSISDILEAKSINDSSSLVNLMCGIPSGQGSYYYQGKWGGLDQFIVSNNLIYNHHLDFKIDSVSYFNPKWLLKDEKPFRTYSGNYYLGGYSDHLPIVMYYKNIKE